MKRFEDAGKLPYEPVGVRDDEEKVTRRWQENASIRTEARSYISDLEGGQPNSKVPSKRTFCLLPAEKELCGRPHQFNRKYERFTYRELLFVSFE